MMKMVIYQLKKVSHIKQISLSLRPFSVSQFIVMCLVLLNNVQHCEFSAAMI